MSSSVKNILIALAIALALWLGYILFLKESEPDMQTQAGAASQAGLEAQEFLMRLQQLNNISTDAGIFSDVRFNSLVDFRQQLTPEPVGRRNPFAPLP